MNKFFLILLASIASILPAVAGTSIPNASTNSFQGKIVWKKDDGSKITLKKQPTDPASTAFLVTTDTKIIINGASKEFDDLKTGWSATVTPKAANPAEASSIEVSKQ